MNKYCIDLINIFSQIMGIPYFFVDLFVSKFDKIVRIPVTPAYHTFLAVFFGRYFGLEGRIALR